MPKHWLLLIALLTAPVAWTGCSGKSIRSQSPEQADELLEETKLVSDLAAPAGMNVAKVEAVGMVTGLAGTGSDPPPSYERSAVLADMQTRGIESPNKVLASPSTSVVIVTGYLRPGIQKGDKFDIEVRVPSRSETTSLRGGWLMESRLKELARLNNQIREGDTWALGQGPILVDPSAELGRDKLQLTRGRILGGGVCRKPRSIGLVLKPAHRSVPKSSAVGAAINQRFHTYHNGTKQGVATPQNDEFVALLIHPRYKDNVARYMQVVRAVPLKETSLERLDRLKLLEKQLLDPVTADTAALRLEAIGGEAIPTLKKGLEAEDPLVRFYAGEALAYLDDSAACAPLAEAARDHRAFRLFALTALSTMSDFDAYEALVGLLDAPSAETRYGAFRALWAMNPRDPLVLGKPMKDAFTMHVLDVSGPPMVHVTHNFRAELVLFGKQHALVPPFALDAGANLLVKAEADSDQATVTRFDVDGDDQRLTCGLNLTEVVEAMVELGGAYPDVVQLLQQAKVGGALAARLEVDAVPEPGRTYFIGGSGDDAPDEPMGAGQGVQLTQPLPDLFPKLARPKESAESTEERPTEEVDSEAEKPRRKRGILGRLKD